jgi:hypothetical protein
MHVPTHILSGWCLGNLVPKLGARQRLFCMIAATIPDIDGIGIVGDFLLRHDEPVWYWTLHHKMGHGALACLVVVTVLTALSSRHRCRAAAAYLAAFHLHIVMDYFGSGPNWDIYYGWPVFDGGWVSSDAWPLSSWQNTLSAFVLLVWTAAIARWQGRTPLELLMSSLDRRWVAAVQWRRSPVTNE